MAVGTEIVTTGDLAEALYRERFRFVTEIDLQDAIADLLVLWEKEHIRECVLTPRDRIDFLVGTTGIEVKIQSALASVQRQLFRYAAHPKIESLILVTTRHAHKAVPASILDKPVYVVHLINSIF